MTIILTAIFDFALNLIKSLAKLIGWGGVAAIGIVFYFTGLPVINRIPYISYVPFAGEIAVGRMQTYADEQVKAATSAMVAKAELDAANAVIEHERHMRDAATQAATEAARRADAAKLLANVRQAKIEELTKEASGMDSPTEKDLQWLKSH